MERVRVLLADDHTLVRQGLRALLEREPGIEVIEGRGLILSEEGATAPSSEASWQVILCRCQVDRAEARSELP